MSQYGGADCNTDHRMLRAKLLVGRRSTSGSAAGWQVLGDERCGKERDRKKHAHTLRETRKAVGVAKDAWFQQKALAAGRGRRGGKLMWRCIRAIHHFSASLQHPKPPLLMVALLGLVAVVSVSPFQVLLY